jgi:hypothetical protein
MFTQDMQPSPPGLRQSGARLDRGSLMIRLVAGVGALAVLVLAGGAACGGLNGLPAAQPAAPVLSRAVPQGRGVISGRFVIFGTMGRPGAAVDHPARGTVVFTRGRHRVLIVQAGRSGIFVARLPAGTYHVYGRSPQLTTASGNGTEREDKITLPHPVTVTAGHTTKIILKVIVP